MQMPSLRVSSKNADVLKYDFKLLSISLPIHHIPGYTSQVRRDDYCWDSYSSGYSTRHRAVFDGKTEKENAGKYWRCFVSSCLKMNSHGLSEVNEAVSGRCYWTNYWQLVKITDWSRGVFALRLSWLLFLSEADISIHILINLFTFELHSGLWTFMVDTGTVASPKGFFCTTLIDF